MHWASFVWHQTAISKLGQFVNMHSTVRSLDVPLVFQQFAIFTWHIQFVDFPIARMVIFHSYVNVSQWVRVDSFRCLSQLSIQHSGSIWSRPNPVLPKPIDDGKWPFFRCFLVCCWSLATFHSWDCWCCLRMTPDPVASWHLRGGGWESETSGVALIQVN